MSDVFYDWTRITAARKRLRAALREGRVGPEGAQSFINGYCKRSASEAERVAAEVRARKKPRQRSQPKPLIETEEDPAMAIRKKTAAKKTTAKKTPVAKKTASKKASANGSKKTVAKKTTTKRPEPTGPIPERRPGVPMRGPGSKPRIRTRVGKKVFANFTAAARAVGIAPEEAVRYRNKFRDEGEVTIGKHRFVHAEAEAA